MTDHASTLELDEVAAGLAHAVVRAHVENCTDCRVHLARISASRTQTMDDPRFARTLANLPATRERRWQRWVVPAAAAMAAGVLLLVDRPMDRGMRAKGGASLALVSNDGHSSNSPRVGDVLEMRFNSGSHRFALVMAVEQYSTTVLWPPQAVGSGPLAPGTYASVQMRVTPGQVRVLAAFSDEPLKAADVKKPVSHPGVEFRELEVKPRP